MQDVLYIAGTIVFFALMVLFAAGCGRIIGTADGDSFPGGLPDEPTPTSGPKDVNR
jgi:hypothetical protein